MRLPAFIERRLIELAVNVATTRPPDFMVGGDVNPYLKRWWLVPRNRLLNIYLHQFLRDDDDRALHDHPWPWCSILIVGSYYEHTIAAGGVHRRTQHLAPSIRFGRAAKAHRISLVRDACTATGVWPAWTLFITGPRIREWGFHCPDTGWVHWRKFTDPSDVGRAGPGCGGASDA